MVTRIGQRRPRRLFLTEWMDFKELSDEKLGLRLGVARQTVHRWRTQPHRVNPDKQALIASALDCEPEDLWRLPNRPSIDSLLKNEPEAVQATAFDIVRRLLNRA